MFILRLIRYLRGYVKFHAKGAFVERFLNLAARNRIPIWDGRKRGDSFSGATIASSYGKLRHHAKKTGVRMRITEKHGVPFKRRQYRTRTGLLVGLGLFCAFVFLTSRFIWRIEVAGNERVGESHILSALHDIGVTPGVLRSSIDVRGAERRALLRLDELSWIALNIRGSTVHVEVRERGEQPVLIDPNTPCNVIAARSGQILSMVVFDGQSVKQVGDTVLEGDIIASGITQDRLGQNLFRHARAQVIARVQHQIVVEAPLVQPEYKETGEVRTRRFLHVFDWDLPLFWPKSIPQPYHATRSKSMLQIAGAQLPIGILCEEYILMQQVNVTYSEEEAKLLALGELNLRQKTELAGAEIIDKTAIGSLNNDIFTVTADYVCTMDIAQEREILKPAENGVILP